MRVTLIGMGPGAPSAMTIQAAQALEQADLLIGSARLLEGVTGCTRNRKAETKADAICRLLLTGGAERPCVLYSGDSGFYSGARSLLPLLEEQGMEAELLPGISSVQAFAARIGQPWQDWTLVSAHGVTCDLWAALRRGKPVFFLTGGAHGPARLCRQLTDLGLGGLTVTAGEGLSGPEERIRTGTARDFAGQSFHPLSVLLVQPPPVRRRTPGIPDEAFCRDRVPMTKQEVRAVILAKLAVEPEDVCWDIGAGTGSVSVELALQSREVWAVECRPEACDLIRRNRERFGAYNLHLLESRAPEGLESLPAPDAVFVGGSGGALDGVLAAAYRANPSARVCVSAVTLETLERARHALDSLGYEAEIVQIGVSRVQKAGEYGLLTAQNPVFLITGVRP